MAFDANAFEERLKFALSELVANRSAPSDDQTCGWRIRPVNTDTGELTGEVAVTCGAKDFPQCVRIVERYGTTTLTQRGATCGFTLTPNVSTNS